MNALDLIPSETKRRLLLTMKRMAALSLDDAERETGLSRTTLREHLGQLERDGFVERSSSRQGRGRPRLLYSLTRQAMHLFPTQDGVLLGGLLEYLQDRGEVGLVNDFFEGFWAARFRELEFRLAAYTSPDRSTKIKVLLQLLREQGFMPEITVADGTLEIKECNCPFPEAIRHTRLPCRLEAEFFERVFEERLGRVSYIPDGSSACTYELTTGERP
jgi:predicted ArsR family transcriptional regulator